MVDIIQNRDEGGGMQEGPPRICSNGPLKVELFAGERCIERATVDAAVEQRSTWGYALMLKSVRHLRSVMTHVWLTLPDGQELAGGITYSEADSI